MNLLHRLAYRCRALFQKDRLEREMAEEMRFHLEQRAADQVEDGLAADAARCAALRRFGNVGRIEEQARESRGWTRLEHFGKDVRLGLRSLWKSPGFSLLAIVTLGLGIGANTAMFSVLNTIMLKPLPYADGDHLDEIYRTNAQGAETQISPADFLDLTAEMNGYGRIVAYARGDMSLAEPGQPAEMARSIRVSSDFFSVLGIAPQLGRDFKPAEAQHGNHRVLVISQRYWLNRFGGRADVIGHPVRIDGETHEIIGVLPASFNDWRHLGSVDLFRPVGLTKEEAVDRRTAMLELIGRRSPALARTQADGLLANFGKRLAAEFPEANAGSTWHVGALHDVAVGKSGPPTLAMLIGLSGFVLLIACSNLANLLLARTMARAREFAVRSAIGASRLQLLRPLVVESLLLALAGGLAAIFVAVWFTQWLTGRSTGDNGEVVRFALDWSVLGWAFAASVLTAVAFGIAPALFAMRLDLNRTLKSGARGSTGGPVQHRVRQVLIIGQFALAMVLLAGAALFVRGLADLNNRRAGWESDNLIAGTILLPATSYPGTREIAAFQRLTVERLETLPGVRSASLSYTMPFFGLSAPRKYRIEGRATPKPGEEPSAAINGVSPRYFETVGTRLLQGRVFSDSDNLASRKVFIISQAMAAALFGAESPLGRRLAHLGSDEPEWGEVVGVVADVQSVYPERGPVTNQLYQPLAQEGWPMNEIAVRTNGVDPSTLVHAISATMTALHPDLPVRRLQPADERISRANYQLGVLRDMLSTFALLGLGLASLGIYGVIARTVAQRSGEFSIRLALGAQVRDITRLVLASGVRLALIGSALGLLGAVGISRLLASAYPGMRMDSPPVILGVTLLLVAVALIACYLPARRAAGINPIESLRAE